MSIQYREVGIGEEMVTKNFVFPADFRCFLFTENCVSKLPLISRFITTISNTGF